MAVLLGFVSPGCFFFFLGCKSFVFSGGSPFLRNVVDLLARCQHLKVSRLSAFQGQWLLCIVVHKNVGAVQ
jgi:hypothetical protein